MQIHSGFYLCEWTYQMWRTKNSPNGMYNECKGHWLVIAWNPNFLFVIWVTLWWLLHLSIPSLTKWKIWRELFWMFPWTLICFVLVRIEKQSNDFKTVVDSPSPTGGLAIKVIPQPFSHISQVEICEVKEACLSGTLSGGWDVLLYKGCTNTLFCLHSEL